MRTRLTLGTVVALALSALLYAQTNVANTAASLAGKHLVTVEDPWTITGLYTFSRSSSAPFAVNSGAASVANLDADKLDGHDSPYFLDLTNATGTLPTANLPTIPIANLPTITVAKGGTNLTATPANGQLLIGNGTGYTLATLTGGAGISVTNGAGTITLANTGGVLDRQVTLANIVNSVTETALYTYAVQGGTLSTNKTLHLSAIGDLLNNSGASRTFTTRVKYGATTMFTAQITNLNAGANRGALLLDCELTAANATSAQRSKCTLDISGTNGNNAGGSAVTVDLTGGAPGINNSTHQYAAHNALAEDSTLSKNLVVTIQLGTADPSYDGRLHTVYTEIK